LPSELSHFLFRLPFLLNISFQHFKIITFLKQTSLEGELNQLDYYKKRNEGIHFVNFDCFTRASEGLLFISPLGKHVRYVLRLHFPASNNVAEYEALVNGLRIAVELGVRRLDARGDSQLVIDQVMKNSHYRDPKMEAYCDEVWRLEDKFYGLELNHIARLYNKTADELAKIASGRTTVPPNVFSRDIHQPSVKIDDTPEPEEASA
jgi:ribonuclease HI